MVSGIVTQKLGAIIALFLCLFLFAPVATATNVLTADRMGSRPPNSNVPNVPVEKGKRPGLLFKLNCVEQMHLTNSGNVCFPIHGTASTVVTVKIGNNPITTCSATPASPGGCSYSFEDAFQRSSTCGPGGNQPCKDTVRIVYNGVFPAFATVQYSAAGISGVNGEQENLANLVTFSTGGNTPTAVNLGVVFDISGSMALAADVSPPPTRMDALRFSARTLFNILNAYALPGDQLASVFFGTQANPDASSRCSDTLDVFFRSGKHGK